MTPAETLAAERPRRRARRNSSARSPAWVCLVRAERERLNLPMRAVAEVLGMSLANLSAVENGSDPQLSTAKKLAAFYGKPVDDLWPRRADR